ASVASRGRTWALPRWVPLTPSRLSQRLVELRRSKGMAGDMKGGAGRHVRGGLPAWVAASLKVIVGLTVVSVLVLAPTATSATPGLVAEYAFEGGGGTTISDASGKGNSGTAASTTWAATGKYGKALSFNGTSSLVTITDAASLHLAS